MEWLQEILGEAYTEEIGEKLVAHLEEQERSRLLSEKLSSQQFSSDFARQGVYDILKERVRAEEGQLLGFEEALADLKEAQPEAFLADSPVFSRGDMAAPKVKGFQFHFASVK